MPTSRGFNLSFGVGLRREKTLIIVQETLFAKWYDDTIIVSNLDFITHWASQCVL
jgi:hypothetical protein